VTYNRGIEEHVRKILWDYRKMAFINGPRQVGKTTLARKLLAETGQGRYFNWDDLNDQRTLSRDPYFYEKVDREPGQEHLVVLDEIHKYRRWKSYLKGAFDRSGREHSFLVTGSGRLDLYSKGGDSLLGRYLGVPLFPLTVGEIAGKAGSYTVFKDSLVDPPRVTPEAGEAFTRLSAFNGFPEPFSRGEKEFLAIWSAQRRKLLVREDIRDATSIRQLSQVEMLTSLLPERVGSPLSVSSMREDLGVAFETVRDWVAILHQFFYSFPVLPYSKSLSRAIQKAVKVYLFDWSEVPGEPARFENTVALHLHKAVSLWNARGEAKTAVRYLRDREKREVDFVITEKNKPVCLVECKLSETTVAAQLLQFQEKLGVPVAVQVVATPGVCRKIRTETGVAWVISAERWLRTLP
jgi:predicted AAA+ superfamily ATPase